MCNRNMSFVMKMTFILRCLMVFSLFWSMAVNVPQAVAQSISADTRLIGKNNNSDSSESDNGGIVFFDFTPIEIEEVEIEKVKIEEVEIERVKIEEIKIETIDKELISIDDEIVLLAEKNFKDVYGKDFDLKKFLIDLGVGTTCVVICASLSVAGGPVGTYFGVVISDGIISSTIIMAAIEGGIEAYKAYEEGGDISYIAGHTLNGLANGAKWGAILAPVDTAYSGIKYLRATSKLKALKGFESISRQEEAKLVQQFPSIYKSLEGVDLKNTYQVKSAYKKWLSQSKEYKFSEELFLKIGKNRSKISSIIKELKVPRIYKAVEQAELESQRTAFLKAAGFSGKSGEEFIRKIQSGKIVSVAKTDYIQKNLSEFIDLFGPKLTKQFLDNCLKNELGEELFVFLQSNIAKPDVFVLMLEKFPKKDIAKIFGENNVVSAVKNLYPVHLTDSLFTQRELFYTLSKIDNLSERTTVLRNIINGNIKNLSQIPLPKKVKIAVPDLHRLATGIKDMKLHSAYSLAEDIAKEMVSLKRAIPPAVAEDIISNGLSKEQIINNYGKKIYKRLLSEQDDVSFLVFGKLATNTKLIREMTTDILKSKNIDEKVIEKILSGKDIGTWGITEKKQAEIANTVIEYYKASNLSAKTIDARIIELGEVRGKFADRSRWTKCLGQGVMDRINISEAGESMETAGKINASYIRKKYGEIYMNKSGFPVFDKYSIARVVVDNLTGKGKDISLANKMFYGSGGKLGGYTWHHLEDGRTLILIPTELHEAYRHTGGASLLRNCAGK